MRRHSTHAIAFALAMVVVATVSGVGSVEASAALPPPGSTYHQYGVFNDGGRGAYTGIYQRRPDQLPTSGLSSDCNAGVVIPIYYPAWVIITEGQDWVEIGTSFFCTTNWNWYEGWGDLNGFHWRGQQFTPALGAGHYFQIYRVGENWHWQIGASEQVPQMFWNAVGIRAAAGIESYNSQGITNYFTHDLMNVTLSESAWTPYSGSASVSDGGVRMCSVRLSGSSFMERQKSSGTAC